LNQAMILHTQLRAADYYGQTETDRPTDITKKESYTKQPMKDR